ncbi:MAG: CHAP domain-containing protein [Candidatus Dormibacteria bacterium]
MSVCPAIPRNRPGRSPRRARALSLSLAGAAIAAAIGAGSITAHANTVPFGTVLVAGATWAGADAGLGDLNVYSNGSGTQDRQGTFGLEYECTELAQRWAHFKWGEPDTWPISRASDMWAAGPSLPIPLSQNPNGGASPPQFGDIIVYGATSSIPTGHVGVVAGVTASSVTVAQENLTVNGTPTGEWTEPLHGTSAPPLGGLPVLGWLRSGELAPALSRAPAAPAHPPLISASSPSTAIMPDGSTQTVFWQGPNNDLFEKWFAGGTWNGPVDVSAAYFGGSAPLQSAPAVTITAAGTQIVFWRGQSNHVFEAWYSGRWNGPVDVTVSYFGGGAPASSAPSATVLNDGTQLVFWQGASGHVFEAWWKGRWTGPVDWTAAAFGGAAPLNSSPSITVASDGTQLVFWQGPSGHVFEAWWKGRWTGPVDWTAAAFGGAAPLRSSPSVAVASDGTQLVFWQGPSGHLYEAWWKGRWSGPVDWTAAAFAGTSPLTSAPSVAVTAAGAQLVFWQGGSQTLWEAWFTAHWNGPGQLGS